jgi:hypothetical protein
MFLEAGGAAVDRRRHPRGAPAARREAEGAEGRRSITLGGTRYSSPQAFALAAAEAQRWDDPALLLDASELEGNQNLVKVG